MVIPINTINPKDCSTCRHANVCRYREKFEEIRNGCNKYVSDLDPTDILVRLNIECVYYDSSFSECPSIEYPKWTNTPITVTVSASSETEVEV